VQTSRRLRSSRRAFTLITVLLGVAVGAGAALVAQTRRDFEVSARRYAFTVVGSERAELRVSQNDLVHVTFSTEDIPHSFTIEDQAGSHYRIMRRAEAGKSVSFDFRADTPGRFRFYCSLTIDPQCKDMQGVLIVDPK
jgi:heme/copper-type cytochrome/quinol oxidase subunit 2